MKTEQEYIRDITEIRSMMERSSKFLSLSGWAGIMAGIYALSGACIARWVFDFNPVAMVYSGTAFNTSALVLLGLGVLVLALCTAVYFSLKSAGKRNEKIWNHTSRQLLVSLAVPLAAGGILVLTLILNGLAGLAAPVSLLFYGLALFSAGKFTFTAVKVLGLVEITLGLLGAWFIAYGLLFWSLGFGLAHIIYGIYVYYRYER